MKQKKHYFIIQVFVYYSSGEICNSFLHKQSKTVCIYRTKKQAQQRANELLDEYSKLMTCDKENISLWVEELIME